MKTKKTSIKQLITLAALGSAAFAYADDPIYTGTFEATADTGDVVGSLKANIAVDAEINRATVSDIKTSETDDKVITSGGVTSESIDLAIKATSKEGNATAFQAGSISLDGEIEIKKDVYDAYKNPEAIVLSDGGTLKGTFEAVAEKGIAKAFSVTGEVDADENEIQLNDENGFYVDEIESKPGSIDIKAIATGKEAYGISALGFDAGNVKLDAVATANGGDAIAIESNYITADEKATIDASARAEGGNAIALNVADVSAADLTINAVAETVVAIEPNTSAVIAPVIYKVGNATAIQAQIETGNIYDVEVADYADKKLPADILKDVSRTINATAIAGSYVDNNGDTLGGKATAFDGGDLRVGNIVYIDNIAENADGDDADAKMAKAKEMPVIDLNAITPSKVELNGSFVAKAPGGTATAINTTGNLEVGSEITVARYQYVMENVVDENGQPVLDEAGNPVQKISFDENGKPVIATDANNELLPPAFDTEFIIGDFNADVYAEGMNANGIIANDITANLNGDITAIASNGDAVAVSVNAIKGAVNGNVSAIANVGNATAIEAVTANAVINGKVSAEVYNEKRIIRDGAITDDSALPTNGKAVAIQSTDGVVNLGDGAIVSARQYVVEELVDTKGNVLGVELKNDGYGFALTNTPNGGAGLTVNVAGQATVRGNVQANSPLNIGGNGTLVVEGGTLSGDAINIAETAGLSLAAGYDGNLAEIDAATPVVFDAIAKAQAADQAAGVNSKSTANAMAASKRAEFIAGSATALVNDQYDFEAGNNNAFSNYDANGTATALKVDDLKNIDGNMVNFDYTLDPNAVIGQDGAINTADIDGVKVNKLSYFQTKAVTADQRSLGFALDAIETIEAPEGKESADEEAARKAAIQARRDFKAAVDARNMNDFMPQANTQLAQINSEMLMNVNLAKAYRMTSIADAKRAQGESQKPASTKNAAELISINMLGSQDGEGAAEGFDFWSAGALAAIERDFSENLLAGISLGGIYNKIEGDNLCDSDSTSFLADIYAVYTFKDMPLDIFANFGYAHSWNEASRVTPDGNASVDYDSNAFNTLGGVVYTFNDVGVKGLTLKPMAMYNIVYLSDDSATENGAGIYNAKINSNDYVNVRTLIGLEAKYDIDSNFAVMARAFWVHEFCDTSYDANYRVNVASSYMNSAKYRGISSERDAALIGLGCNYSFSETVSAFLDYTATLRSDYSAHGFDLGVKFRF